LSHTCMDRSLLLTLLKQKKKRWYAKHFTSSASTTGLTIPHLSNNIHRIQVDSLETEEVFRLQRHNCLSFLRFTCIQGVTSLPQANPNGEPGALVLTFYIHVSFPQSLSSLIRGGKKASSLPILKHAKISIHQTLPPPRRRKRRQIVEIQTTHAAIRAREAVAHATRDVVHHLR
jgi:hypothetical protein